MADPALTITNPNLKIPLKSLKVNQSENKQFQSKKFAFFYGQFLTNTGQIRKKWPKKHVKNTPKNMQFMNVFPASLFFKKIKTPAHPYLTQHEIRNTFSFDCPISTQLCSPFAFLKKNDTYHP